MVSPHTTLPHHARLVVSRRHLKEMPRNLGGGPSHTSQTLAYSCVALSGTLALPLGTRAAFPVPVRSEETDPGCGSQVKVKAGVWWRQRATSCSPGRGQKK